LVRTNPSSSSQTGAHRCRTCSIFITFPTVSINTASGRYILNSKGTYHTSNVIHMLTCKFCDAFNVRETGCALNLRINNHRYFSTINKPDARVSLHTESHNTNFVLSFLVAIIDVLPPTTNTSTRRLWEGFYSWFQSENET